MKTKWRLYILWSVFALGIVNCTPNRDASSSVQRRVKRKKVFRLGTEKTSVNTDSSRDPGFHPLLQLNTPGPTRLKTSLESDFAYLPDVSVTCSTSNFVVRVKPAFYGLGASAEELKLGDACKSNGVLSPYGDLLFTYPLTECGALREMPPGSLVYKFVLRYVPSPKRFRSRAHPIDVNIECRFHRYHHVYQLAVRPTWKTAILRKKLRGRTDSFQIQLMDDSWTMPAKSQVYQLGQTVNFQVSASLLPPGGKMYISSCYVKPSKVSRSTIKYPIIDNFGCLLESQRDPGASQFVSPRTDKTLRVSLNAFQFTSHPDTQINIHCKVFVTSEDPGPTHKSCTYRENGWTALTGADSICKCCESQCVTSKQRRAMMEGSASSGPLLVSDQPSTPEDGYLPVGVGGEGALEDILAFEMDMNQQITELHSTENLWDHTDLPKYDGDEGRRSYTDLEKEETQLNGDGRITAEVVKDIGFENLLDLTARQFLEERQKFDGGDLEEFGEDGSGYLAAEEFLRWGEQELGWKSKSEKKEAEPGKVNVREQGASEREGVHQQEKDEVETLHVVWDEETLALESGSTHLIQELGEDEDQLLETESEEQVEHSRDMHIGKGEEGDGTIFPTEQTHGQVSADGPVEAGVVDDGEMTWYFTWR
ncbi:zona pellucida sperm-binding protein 3 [Lampris incognitus]|uniref:zona pellucida sperm-binding protein 3 n=1 Tax=Lampris incognitus TaxID=2546036 RepID=UPI0024B56401|nr:zona pellucida sperm-binding protein 3 [Lampris incognitus]